jgi:hypothetical protein
MKKEKIPIDKAKLLNSTEKSKEENSLEETETSQRNGEKKTNVSSLKE